MTGQRRNQPLGEIAVKPTYRIIDGVSIRFVESDPGETDALLLSPWPESIMAYEPIWLALAETTHLVAIDLPGFGRSERKDALMSPRAMGFLSLLVGTGGSAVPLQLGAPLREWVFAPDLEAYRPIGGRSILERVIQTLERYVLSDSAREDYLASYEGTRFAESIRYVQSYPTELEVLRDVLPHIQTPARIVAGRRDTVVPPVNAEYLNARLPRSDLHLLDSGRFVWEDAADDYAALVRAWWDGGCKAFVKRSSEVTPEVVTVERPAPDSQCVDCAADR
jgi:pimeloyl-ACP methyl ester carboxylesterase